MRNRMNICLNDEAVAFFKNFTVLTDNKGIGSRKLDAHTDQTLGVRDREMDVLTSLCSLGCRESRGCGFHFTIHVVC